jgi:uncharacterized pyridoxamine 5'-phosphate oxidase family protein
MKKKQKKSEYNPILEHVQETSQFPIFECVWVDHDSILEHDQKRVNSQFSKTNVLDLMRIFLK